MESRAERRAGVLASHLRESRGECAPVSAAVFEVVAPFPGQMVEFKAGVGEQVAAGSVLCVVSAMKMLNDIEVEQAGKVLEIKAKPGQQVSEGTVLAVLTPVADAAPSAAPQPQQPQSAKRQTQPQQAGAGAPTLPSGWYSQGAAPEQLHATPAIRSKVRPQDPATKQRRKHNLKLADELKQRLDVVRKGGGGRYEKLHRKRGKMLVRERIAAIIDPGTDFLELSTLAAWGMYDGEVYAGGRCIGVGMVCGRECMFIGTDATVKGGVYFAQGLRKELRAQEIAEANHLPCIYLIDGGGAKLDATAERPRDDGKGDVTFKGVLPADFTHVGVTFRNQACMSAKGIPQIAVVCGMCTAGGAYVPAMCDETIIVQGNGTVYLGGPPLVKAATGEEADEQNLGGAVMHTSKSGTCDHLARDEPTAFLMCREVIEHVTQRRPRALLQGMQQPEPPLYDPDTMLDVIPESTTMPFDIREVIARIVDGSRFHEFKPRYGPTLVCGWAHIEGYPVAILGNNGMLFSESALKATHFLQICGKRGTPLIFLHNISGFIIGTAYEHRGITKDGAKMVHAVATTPCPKFAVVCGGSHGAGNYAMCGPAFDPRFLFLWPNAKICVMGGEQAAGVVAVVQQNKLKREGKAPMSAEQEERLKAPIREGMERSNSAYHSTSGVYDDGIIDPRETRSVLARAISVSLNAPFPDGRHGVFRM